MNVDQLKSTLSPFFTKKVGLYSVGHAFKKVGWSAQTMSNVYEVVEGQAVLDFNVNLSKDFHWEEREHVVSITVDLSTLAVIKVAVANGNKGARKHNTAIKEAAMILFNEVMENVHNSEPVTSQEESTVTESVETSYNSNVTVSQAQNAITATPEHSTVNTNKNTYNSNIDTEWINQITSEIAEYNSWISDGYEVEYAKLQINKLSSLLSNVITGEYEKSA